ncbi:MAG: pantoate--beta-alanine ligase, partial [Pseudomonadales bacterium]|nr:pantoate--beta-alanine ligase [Pseudomonadales bacterium]
MTELNVLPSLAALRTWREIITEKNLRLGLVPTMGNLHAGHIALVRAAKAECDAVLATLFVNPLQFGANEDLDRYPRTFTADCAALQAAGCTALFAPTASELYPHGFDNQTRISVPQLSALHCG